MLLILIKKGTEMSLIQILMLLLSSIVLLGVPDLKAGVALRGEQALELSSPDISVEARYEALLREEIKKAQTRVTKLLAGMSGRTISPADKLQVDNAMAVLQLKEKLMRNFIGTPSMKSPTIRGRLMMLMKKDFIAAPDLTELKGLVAQERNLAGR